MGVEGWVEGVLMWVTSREKRAAVSFRQSRPEHPRAAGHPGLAKLTVSTEKGKKHASSAFLDYPGFASPVPCRAVPPPTSPLS